MEREVPVPIQTSPSAYSGCSRNSPRFAHEISPLRTKKSKERNEDKSKKRDEDPLAFINHAYTKIYNR